MTRAERVADAEDMGMTVLPPAVPTPCNECPWRRDSTPGHLGPMTADEWERTLHGEEAIACHKTIERIGDDGHGSWDDPSIRQCAGAAIARTNTHKLPWNPTDATRDVEADRDLVFGRTSEFVEHHERR